MSVNQVILLGRIGRDAVLRRDVRNEEFATASLATNYHYKDKATLERREAAEWHNLVFPPHLAQRAMEKAKKGASLYIEGRLHTQKLVTKTGERYVLQIIVERFSDTNDTSYSGPAPQQDYHAEAAAPARAPSHAPQQPHTGSATNTYARAKG